MFLYFILYIYVYIYIYVCVCSRVSNNIPDNS